MGTGKIGERLARWIKENPWSGYGSQLVTDGNSVTFRVLAGGTYYVSATSPGVNFGSPKEFVGIQESVNVNISIKAPPDHDQGSIE